MRRGERGVSLIEATIVLTALWVWNQWSANGALESFGHEGDPGSFDAERVQQSHTVGEDVALGRQVRRDVDDAIGERQQLRVARQVEQEGVAGSRGAAQAGRLVDHRRHQLVGVQRALHDHLHIVCARQLDGFLGRGVAVRHVDDLDAKFNQASALLPEATGWSEYDRGFRRAFLKHLPERPGAPPVNPDGPLGNLSPHTLDLFGNPEGM